MLPTLAKDATESTDPIEPIERTDPVEWIDRTDPREWIDNTDPFISARPGS